MNNLNIAPTQTTPAVIFDATQRSLEFSGQSYPENALQFYRGIQQALESYLAKNTEPLTVNFKLDYFNTSSSKCVLDLMECLEKCHKLNNNITINWYYLEGDEDMYDNGVDFSLDIKIPFNLIVDKRSN
jgi:hypothetical protein